jgi:hypothetical protein
MDTNELLAKYTNGYKRLTDLLADIPERAIFFKPIKESWSIAEVIVHLADSEAHGYIRAKKIIAECGGKVCVYNHQIWADNLFYYEMNYHDSMQLIQLLRRNMISVLKKIEPGVWHNYIYHPETGKITLVDWIQYYNDHIDVHLEQIQHIFNEWKKEDKKEYVDLK